MCVFREQNLPIRPFLRERERERGGYGDCSNASGSFPCVLLVQKKDRFKKEENGLVCVERETVACRPRPVRGRVTAANSKHRTRTNSPTRRDMREAATGCAAVWISPCSWHLEARVTRVVMRHTLVRGSPVRSCSCTRWDFDCFGVRWTCRSSWESVPSCR